MDIPAPWDVPERLSRLVGDLRSVGTRAEEDLRAFGTRAQELQLQLASAVEVWREIATLGRENLGRLERLDQRSQAVGDVLDKLPEALDSIVRIEAHARDVAERGGEIIERADTIIAALPTIERIVEIIGPLEGTVDRLGRIVDRLPGAAKRAAEPAKGSTESG